MTANACFCWNLQDGSQAVATWSIIFSLVFIGILGWQTSVIIGCRDNMMYVAMRDRHTSCYSLPEDCPCFRSMSSRSYHFFLQTAYIIQLVNIVILVGLLFGSFALLFGISQKTRGWFWAWIPWCALSIIVMAAYCVAWWSGFAQGYWIALTVLAALGSVFNAYGLFVVCSLYKEFGSQESTKTYRIVRQRPEYQEIRKVQYQLPEPNKKVQLVRRDFYGEAKRPLLQSAEDSPGTKASDDSGYPSTPQTIPKQHEALPSSSLQTSSNVETNHVPRHESLEDEPKVLIPSPVRPQQSSTPDYAVLHMKTSEVKVQLARNHRSRPSKPDLLPLEYRDVAVQNTSTAVKKQEQSSTTTESSSDTDANKRGKYGRRHRGRSCNSDTERRSRSKSPHHKRIEKRHRSSRHYDSDSGSCNAKRKHRHSEHMEERKPAPPPVPLKPMAKPSPQQTATALQSKYSAFQIQSELTIHLPKSPKQMTGRQQTQERPNFNKNSSCSSLVSPQVYV